MIQQETPKPPKTNNNNNNKKKIPRKQINLSPKTRHQHLKLLPQRQYLQLQPTLNKQHNSPLQQHLILLIQSFNLQSQPQQPTSNATSTTTLQQRRLKQLMSQHFQHNVKWWEGHIIYKNIQTKRFELLLSNFFLILPPRKGRHIMRQMKGGVSICRERSGGCSKPLSRQG